MEGKYTFDLDLDRCTGCFACVVACMDQNSTDVSSEKPFREVVTVSGKHSANGKIAYFSIACMHCADAPCIVGCPTGALYKDEETQFTAYNQTRCIACHSCMMACPYGAPRFGLEGTLNKCNGCMERVKSGLLPACVRACPTKAIRFDLEENLKTDNGERSLRRELEKSRAL